MKSMRDMIKLMEGVMAVPGINEAKFKNVSCSQCGEQFGPGDSGYSHCSDHKGKTPISEDESDMQTAGTVGRNASYAEFDSAQQPATEGTEFDNERHYREGFAFGQAVKSGQHAKLNDEEARKYSPAFIKGYQAARGVSEEAPPGMEDVVMKLKKEYPDDHSKAFATAWSIYNKKHGKAEEGCTMEEAQVDTCRQSNPATADVACAMEESVSDLTYEQQYSRFSNLINSFVEPQQAFDVISREMVDQGIEGEEHDNIMQRLENDFFPDDSAFDMMNGPDDFSDDADALASAGHGSDEDYGSASDMEFEEGILQKGKDFVNSFRKPKIAVNPRALEYAVRELISVMSEPGANIQQEIKTAAKKYDLPPDALVGEWKKHSRSSMEEARSSDINPDEVKALATMQVDAAKARAQEIIAASTTGDNKKRYLANQINRARTAMDVAGLMYNMILAGEGNAVQGSGYGRKFNNAMEEDINNGYDDVNFASGNDFFPNGADSPVVRAVGPSGARQGDNPEQKRMQVAEVHKELVYGYRNFLKESAQASQKKS